MFRVDLLCFGLEVVLFWFGLFCFVICLIGCLCCVGLFCFWFVSFCRLCCFAACSYDCVVLCCFVLFCVDGM